MNVEKIKLAIAALASCKQDLSSKQATIGFDGYIDELVSVVKNRSSIDVYQKFKSLSEFGSFIATNIGSCGLEIVTNAIKIGGNGPIFANALANAGVSANCIGTFGQPEIHSIFKEMPHNCNLVSIGNPAYTQAFEFEDGKMMLGKHANLNELTWQTLEDMIGIDQMVRYLDESDLIGMTNWSELIHSNDLWEGILLNCMPHITKNKERYIFFDLADPSKRAKKELYEATKLIEGFSRYGKVVLGLNMQEANLLYSVFYNDVIGCTEPIFLGQKIKAQMPQLDMLVIHSSKQVAAFYDGQVYCEECIKVEQPKVLTGCGDNFNAGLCLGLLMRLPVEQCLLTGIYTAAYYIQYGRGPRIDELINYMVERGNDVNE